jgi:hypothetical protein
MIGSSRALSFSSEGIRRSSSPRALTPLRRVRALALVVSGLAFAPSAFAGDGAAAAEVLFGEGKNLVQAGNYAAACPKFEESQKLDPGMGTLYRLADCYEHIGRTASAWAAFVEVAGSAKTSGQQARADDAKKRAAELEPNLAHLAIRVADAQLAGLVVKRGDVEVGKAQWNTAMPVDPGTVAVEASAPGRKTWRGSIVVQPKAASQIDVPKLDVETAAPSSSIATPSTGADREGLGTRRTLALAAGAAGIVGLGLGTAFGLVSMSKGNDADGRCDAKNTCDTEGLALRRDAIDAGNIATIAFVAGGVLAAGGVVLWLTAPPRGAAKTVGQLPRVGVAPRWAGVALQLELP